MEKLIKSECITKFLKTNKMTPNEFCKNCNISKYTFNKLFKGNNIGMKTIVNVCSYMEIPIHEFLNIKDLNKCAKSQKTQK